MFRLVSPYIRDFGDDNIHNSMIYLRRTIINLVPNKGGQSDQHAYKLQDPATRQPSPVIEPRYVVHEQACLLSCDAPPG